MKSKHSAVYTEQEKLAGLNFLLEIPGFLILTWSAFSTLSMLVWLEYIESLCYAIKSGLIAVISRKLKNNLAYEYNYGIKRIEVFVSIICNALLCIGLCAVFFISIYELFHPKPVSELLLIVVILKAAELSAILFLLLKQKRLKEKNQSPVLRAEYQSLEEKFVFDIVSLVLLCLCYFLRAYPISRDLSSAASLGISLMFMISRAKTIRKDLGHILDKTLDEKKQFVILKCLNAYNNLYEEFVSVSTHQLDDDIFIDLNIKFSADTTYEMITGLQQKLQTDIRKEIPDSIVSVIIN